MMTPGQGIPFNHNGEQDKQRNKKQNKNKKGGGGGEQKQNINSSEMNVLTPNKDWRSA